MPTIWRYFAAMLMFWEQNFWSINDDCATFFRSTCRIRYLNSSLAARYESFAIGMGLCPFTLSMGWWPNRDVDLGRYSFLFVNEPRFSADRHWIKWICRFAWSDYQYDVVSLEATKKRHQTLLFGGASLHPSRWNLWVKKSIWSEPLSKAVV